MRAMAGLWETNGGSISRPPIGKDGIFFVPQQSYATQGTLAAQVVYPKLLEDCKPSAKEITDILNVVGLGAIVRRHGLNTIRNWELELSGGECQRLGFARVLYASATSRGHRRWPSRALYWYDALCCSSRACATSACLDGSRSRI